MQWADSEKQTPQIAYAPQQGEHLRRPRGIRGIPILLLPWPPQMSCFGSSNTRGFSDAHLNAVLLYSKRSNLLSPSSCQPSQQRAATRDEYEGLQGYAFILYIFHAQNNEARKFTVAEKAVWSTGRAARRASRTGTRKSRLRPALPSPRLRSTPPPSPLPPPPYR